MATTRECRWARRPDERPQELLDAALRVFAERGYRATRLEQIAEAAGVTKGTIYYYFANKEDLLLRAVEQRQRAMYGKLCEVLQSGQGPVSVRLRRAVRQAWQEGMGEDGSILRLLVGEVSVAAPQAYRAWVADALVPGWELMAGAIREGQETGEFRRDADADVAARMFVSSIMMQTLLQPRMAADEVAPIDGERLIDSAIELFLHSLRPVGVAVQPASSRTAVPLGDAKPEASLPAYGE